MIHFLRNDKNETIVDIGVTSSRYRLSNRCTNGSHNIGFVYSISSFKIIAIMKYLMSIGSLAIIVGAFIADKFPDAKYLCLVGFVVMCACFIWDCRKRSL